MANKKSKEKKYINARIKKKIWFLIWNESDGYIIPNREVYKLKRFRERNRRSKKIYEDNTDINPKIVGGNMTLKELKKKSFNFNRGIKKSGVLSETDDPDIKSKTSICNK
ncbi:MAG: hypothetical protein L6V81_11200 [Clostridium sp.]|nr:MAG: hypothetical protein L6V81_11200 [Clostridium sp.]